ncbi:MAG: DUF6179 domain-containing protein [Clostridia bacterium]|nr:DUF6179 domain-containing protein [Clostridia bacterium]
MTMNKSDVMGIYTMEQLIPVVAGLAEEFTSKESCSVTYEKARQLMEAVIYCIGHLESCNSLLAPNSALPAKEAYLLGYEAVKEKVLQTHQKYIRLMKFFDHYGNQNYRDTVEKALPAFFLYYDLRFAPMENIITMDYPIFGLNVNLEGIDIIQQYINAIWDEQCYLIKFPRNYIISRLRDFHPKYENEYFNLKEILET